jgi:hypothetical protein
VRTALQEVLEVEMSEALGAENHHPTTASTGIAATKPTAIQNIASAPWLFNPSVIIVTHGKGTHRRAGPSLAG